VPPETSKVSLLRLRAKAKAKAQRDRQAQAEIPEEGPDVSAIDAVGSAAGKGGSLGLSAPLSGVVQKGIAGAELGIGKARQFLGAGGDEQVMRAEETLRIPNEELVDEQRRTEAEAEAAHPGLFKAMEIASGVATTLPLFANPAVAGARGLLSAAPVGRSLATSAALGGIAAGASQDFDSLEDLAKAAKDGALLSASMDAGFRVGAVPVGFLARKAFGLSSTINNFIKQSPQKILRKAGIGNDEVAAAITRSPKKVRALMAREGKGRTRTFEQSGRNLLSRIERTGRNVGREVERAKTKFLKSGKIIDAAEELAEVKALRQEFAKKGAKRGGVTSEGDLIVEKATAAELETLTAVEQKLSKGTLTARESLDALDEITAGIDWDKFLKAETTPRMHQHLRNIRHNLKRKMRSGNEAWALADDKAYKWMQNINPIKHKLLNKTTGTIDGQAAETFVAALLGEKRGATRKALLNAFEGARSGSGKNFIDDLIDRKASDTLIKLGRQLDDPITGQLNVLVQKWQTLGEKFGVGFGGILGAVTAGPLMFTGGGFASASAGALIGRQVFKTVGAKLAKQTVAPARILAAAEGRALLPTMELLVKNVHKFGKFSNVLANAARNGTKSLAASHYMLSQQSPDYREILQKLRDKEDERQ